MKKLILCLLSLALWGCQEGNQKEKLSPYASDAVKISEASIEVSYSSPQKRGRELWGQLVPYGEVWRTGADEATVFSTSNDLVIKGDTLAAGKYSLFTIPTQQEWTVIFNKTWDQWGAFNYDQAQDQLRTTLGTSTSEQDAEGLSIDLEAVDSQNGQLNFKWGTLRWSLPFQVLPKEEKK